MPSTQFEINLNVSSDPAKCWDVLTDVPRLASWVSILHDVTEQARLEKYSAVLLDRLGPFKLKADLDVTVSEVVEGEHIRVQAAGEDRQVSSRIGIDAVLTLAPEADHTAIKVLGSYEVVGKVATLGAGMIKQKANKIIAEFTTQASDALGGV
jgi:uncharacterized protein